LTKLFTSKHILLEDIFEILLNGGFCEENYLKLTKPILSQPIKMEEQPQLQQSSEIQDNSSFVPSENLPFCSTNEEKERKLFLQDLNKFMTESGKPLSKIPIMGYKELDLYQLFKEVINFGGFNEVVKNVGTWSKIWKRLTNFDASITDSSFRLKKNYERYLLEYEFKCKPENRQQNFGERHKRREHAVLNHSTSSSSSSSLASPSTPIYLDINSTSQQSQNNGNVITSFSQSPSSLPEDRKSRNKKSSKKSSAASIEEALNKISRDAAGAPKLPLDFGDFILESIGTVIPRSPWVTEKHIWPVGFRISTMFTSMTNPEINVKYTCSIIESNDKPVFVIYAEDEQKAIQSHSPCGAWKAVFRKLSSHVVDTSRRSVNGTARFGLSNPIVNALIKELLPSDIDKNSVLPSSPSSSSSGSSTNSPASRLRKRKSLTDLYSSEDNLTPTHYVEEEPMKFPRVETVMVTKNSCEEVVFNSREELDDLETAVNILNALKFCTVY